MSQSRAQRLAGLQDEIARAAGYDSFDCMVGADRQRAEQTALLKLQYEVAAARLVGGGELATTELIQLSAAIASTLPPVRAKPIEVVFRDADPSKGGRTEEMRLREERDEARRELAEARKQHVTAPALPPVPNAPPAALPRDNVVPLPRSGNPDRSVLA